MGLKLLALSQRTVDQKKVRLHLSLACLYAAEADGPCEQHCETSGEPLEQHEVVVVAHVGLDVALEGTADILVVEGKEAHHTKGEASWDIELHSHADAFGDGVGLLALQIAVAYSNRVQSVSPLGCDTRSALVAALRSPSRVS